MGRKKLTEQDKKQFRGALLDAALKLFAEEGYEGVSIRALAAAVGCSAMTPYRYFEDKAAIFNACRRRAFEDFAQSQESTAERNPDPMKRIRALGEAYAAYAAGNPDAFRLMFDLDQPEQSDPGLAAAQDRAFATLRSAVADASEAGRLKGDTNTLAHLYWVALHGVVMLDLTNKLVYGRSKRTLLRALFQGVLTSAGR